MNKVKLYTMIPSASGTFRDWKQIVSHAKEMGMNYLHLLPITKMDSSRSPYSANDFFEIDNIYGDPDSKKELMDQFQDFVTYCKKEQMKLCIDIVINHVGINSELTRTKNDWFYKDDEEEDGIKRAGWQHEDEWIKWGDLALLNYNPKNRKSKNDIYKYMADYVLFWSNFAAQTDGMIRFDNFHSCDQGFLKTIIPEIKSNFPNLLLFSELFETQEIKKKMVKNHQIDYLLLTPWDAPHTEETRQQIEFINRQHKIGINYCCPITSHDSPSTTEVYGSPYSIQSRYPLYALSGIGATGLTQGTEFGTPKKAIFIGDNIANLLPSQKFEYNFKEYIAKINSILDSQEKLHQKNNIQFIDNNHPAIVALYKTTKSKDKDGIIILSNLDTSNDQSIKIDFKEIVPQLVGLKADDLLNDKKLIIPEVTDLKMAPNSSIIWEVTSFCYKTEDNNLN